MYKIVNVDITVVNDDAEYFGDKERFGSTEYAEYMRNKDIGLAMYLESRETFEQAETGALLFGKTLHLCLQDPDAFNLFRPGKTQTTTTTGFSKNELGERDYFILKRHLESFPRSVFDGIKKNAEFYEQEVGYFLDIKILNVNTGHEIDAKFRCKPDLAFRFPFDNVLYILDWKTASKFGGSEFTVKYLHQGELYAQLMYLVTGVDSIQHINYIFEKEHPYKQYDLGANDFKITEGSQRLFLNNAVNMQTIRNNHKTFLNKNASLNNDILRFFSN